MMMDLTLVSLAVVNLAVAGIRFADGEPGWGWLHIAVALLMPVALAVR